MGFFVLFVLYNNPFAAFADNKTDFGHHEIIKQHLSPF